MPGYRQGFMDAIVLFVRAADWYKDIDLVVQYMKSCQDKIECFKVNEIHRELGFTFASVEQEQDENAYREYLKTQNLIKIDLDNKEKEMFLKIKEQLGIKENSDVLKLIIEKCAEHEGIE